MNCPFDSRRKRSRSLTFWRQPAALSQAELTSLAQLVTRRAAVRKFHVGLVGIASALGLVCPSVTAQSFTTIKSFGTLTNVTGRNPSSQLARGEDGTLYGTASGHEGNVAGTVFKVQPDGSGFVVLKYFTNWLEGAHPHGGLALSGSVLYGATSGGGSSHMGAVFKVNTDGTGFAVLKNFSAYAPNSNTNSDGALPSGLTLSGSILYGTTQYGGSSGAGTVFKINTNGTGFTVLRHFSDAEPHLDYTNSGGAHPYSHAGPTLSGNVLYGTTSAGGSSGKGTLFKMNTDGTDFTVLKDDFTWTDGVNPSDGLTLSGNVLYGTGGSGGNPVQGTVFRINTDGTGFTVLKQFSALEYGAVTMTNNDGALPNGRLTLSGSVLYGTTRWGGHSGVGTVFLIHTNGTGFSVLRHLSEPDFNTRTNSDGVYPREGLTLSGSTLYGSAAEGGSSGQGTLFKINTAGKDFAVLKNFAAYTDSDGAYPSCGLTMSGNTLYGATGGGGSAGLGTVFKLNMDGSGYTLLKDFVGSDGANPYADLTLSGNVLYGTTKNGGSSGSGTVFKLNTDGTGFTVLKHFSAASSPDYTNSGGALPYGRVTLSGSVLYGTTTAGGSAGGGTLFKLNTDGTGFAVLTSFSTPYTEGLFPVAGLTLSGSVIYGTTAPGWTLFKINTDGTGYVVLKDFITYASAFILSGNVLYGTTTYGGDSDLGTLFKLNTDGTGYVVLRSFGFNPEGNRPVAELTLSGNVLYGTTSLGGYWGVGTVFRMNTDGTGYAVLKEFNAPDGNPYTTTDGRYPWSRLTLSGAALYGTTSSGGFLNKGTIFRLDLSIPLVAQASGNTIILTWSDPSFTLQAAPNVTGVYTNVPGATSPFTNAISGTQRFFRLIGN